MFDILNQLLKFLGPIPGRFSHGQAESLFKIITPQFKQILADRKLQVKITDSVACLNITKCQAFYKAGIVFIAKVYAMYPVRTSNDDFLDERPDFYLGRFLSMFAEEVFQLDLKIDLKSRRYGTDAQKILSNMLQDYFFQYNSYREGEGLASNRNPGCLHNAIDLLCPELYEIYLKLVKHSQIGNTTKTEKERIDFEDMFVKSSIFNTSLEAMQPLYLTDQIDMIPFCEIESFFYLLQISRKREVKCNYFEPIITTNGYCLTFNSLTMKEIFKDSTIAKTWSNVLDLTETSHIINPTGYGSSNGLNFILNSFEPYSLQRSSKNFILSISNENNAFDVFQQKFIISPGYSYTFKVVAAQTVTTERFDSMDVADRGCFLPGEEIQYFDAKKWCSFFPIC
jgi:hypothetical protein